MHLFVRRLKSFFDQSPDCRRIAIWGTGELCDAVIQMLRLHFPDHVLVGVTASGQIHKERRENYVLCSPSDVLSFQPDCVVVASVRYEYDIEASLLELIGECGDTVRTVSGSSLIKALPQQVTEAQDAKNINALENLARLFPEQAIVWRALADTVAEEHKNDYVACWEHLKSTETD